MAFDLEKTIKDMIAAASGVLSGEWPAVKECVEKAFEDEKQALKDIADARLNNEIDNDDVESQLADEKVALEAALLACQVKAKVMAQNAINAAANVFKDALSTALG